MTPPSHRPGVAKAWIVAWIGGAVIAFAGFLRGLNRRWPLVGSRESLTVGGILLALTVCFECGFGRLVVRRTDRRHG